MRHKGDSFTGLLHVMNSQYVSTPEKSYGIEHGGAVEGFFGRNPECAEYHAFTEIPVNIGQPKERKRD